MPTAVDEKVVTLDVEAYRGHRLSNGDEDATHIVDQREGKNQDVAQAYALGEEVIALCGYKLVPWQDPHKLPLCRECVRVLTSGTFL